jgi:outer membrane protein assembly factor BamB
MKLQWFGLPGPRGMIDRGCRNPQPLAVNGFLFVEGLNRLCAQDAYNGRIYWSLEIPRLIRVNIPRDTSNMCADESSLYVAVRDKCWRLDGYSGQLTQHYAAQSPNQSTNYDWGFVALVTNRLYGSSVKRGAAYTEYSGPAFWYDSLGTESTAKVCSDNLFCLSKTDGQPLWTYQKGVIINSSLTIGGGRVYFVASRNATATNQPTGRITSTNLWLDLYLVALDAGSGALLWEQPLSIATSPYPAVFFLCYSAEKLLLTSSTSQFYLYAFSAQNGASLWQKNHAWLRNNHGGHMYHPVIVGSTVYQEPYAYDLTTGNILKSGLPARAGCSTMSAAANMIHTVQVNYDTAALCFWDLPTDQRRQMVGSRASCWMSIISANGMVLSPTASSGCTCRFPLQTSIGFEAP